MQANKVLGNQNKVDGFVEHYVILRSEKENKVDPGIKLTSNFTKSKQVGQAFTNQTLFNLVNLSTKPVPYKP